MNIHRLLFPGDGGGRLYRCTKYDTAAVAESPECSAGMVAFLAHGSLFHTEFIIICTSCHAGGLKSVADLHALDSADGHHCFCQAGV